MPAETIYRPQVDPGATAGLPEASPDAFGAGVGRGMEQLGATLHESKLRAYKIERQQAADTEASDFAARFAEARTEADKASIDARNNAAPGAAGHAEAMKKWWGARSATLLDGITEDHIRKAASEQVAEFGGRLDAAEYQYQEGARVGKVVTDRQQASDLGANRARQMHDPKAYAEELSLGRQAIDMLQGVPADVKEKLHRYHDETVTVGFLNGLNDSNPQGALTLIDAGSFDDILTPAQLEQARSGAQVEVRRQDAIAQHQVALQTAQLHDQVSTLKTLNGNGVEIPDDQFAGAQSRLAALGDTSGATEIGVLRVQNRIARETKPWTPQQYDAAINELAGLPKRSTEQDLRLNYLRQIRGGRVAEFNNDPGGWAADNRLPPPPLNLADPASIAARQGWQRTVSTAAGRPVPLLSKNEAASFAARASASPHGQLEVANELAAFGGRSAFDAAKQVAPADPMLSRLVVLNPQDRASAINGAAARKANPALVDGMSGNDARADFFAELGSAAALLPQQDVGAAFEVARNLYADWAKNGAQDYDGARFKAIMQRALGGAPNALGHIEGGLGEWNGKKVLLPQSLTQAAFDGALTRYVVDPKSPTAPAYADGTVITADQLRRRFVPVQRPDGRYEFHAADGGVATTRGRRIFVMEFPVLPGAAR